MSELKSCPFCGGKAELGHNYPIMRTFSSYVVCRNCGAKTGEYPANPTYTSDEKAIEAWNRRAKGEPMGDSISRQAAIDALTRPMVSIPTAGGKDLMHDVNRIRAQDILVIKRLPSAEPISQIKWERDTAIAQLKELGYGLGAKPKKGKWIPCTEEDDGATFTGCKCSLCNYWKPMSIWNYCPNCGAYMRGEEDE